MSRNKRVLFYCLVATIIAFGCKKTKEDETIVRMAVAANMQYAIKELADQFEKDTGYTCEVILGSSGKLFAQIKEGAPYDLFLSADLTYPEALHAIGLTYELPKVYAYGTLVLWSYTSTLKPSLEVLQTDSVGHIALANPRTAPYGKAAIEVLDFYGLTTSLQDKLVFGESIGQTNQFITSGAADIGFTSQSVVVSQAMNKKGVWIRINEKAYTPMPQGVVLTKSKKPKKRGAQAFYEYLFSGEGKDILQKFGYSVHE
ncbi:molybdate ABC transporter substrate-binding protein [uncultured Muriicola sp.]|uniref:molybdate ABC transporter substrate-binding protein n=1 Tax=uncultured Muriicola sp. TaxID=1583102 RepID=UPI00260BD7B8|nr:molybdate ABC transporter substrate-binding protein [uncultured Muriicola sp.]